MPEVGRRQTLCYCVHFVIVKRSVFRFSDWFTVVCVGCPTGAFLLGISSRGGAGRCFPPTVAGHGSLCGDSSIGGPCRGSANVIYLSHPIQVLLS